MSERAPAGEQALKKMMFQVVNALGAAGAAVRPADVEAFRCVCACVRVRACMRACVQACMRAHVCVCCVCADLCV